MNEVVLFDCDGVLVDSIGVTDRAWVRWAGEYDLDPDAVLAEIHGRPAWMSMEALLPESQRAEALARIVDLETSDSEGVDPIPGAIDLLTSIPTGRAAVVTSATRELALIRTSLAGIPLPDVLLTAEDVQRGKPEPEGWLTAAALLGAEPAQATVLEDSRNGIIAARVAGVGRVIGVGEATRAWDVDVVIPDLTGCRWQEDRLIIGD